MGTRKMRTHEIAVKLRFNKPVTRGAAIRAFNNAVYGEICAGYDEEERDGWQTAKLGKGR